MSVLFTGANPGDIADATAYQANWNLLEASLFDLGPYVISGLSISIGTGLSVNVTAGVASIGGEINAAGSFSIGSLAPSTTNHLYLLQNGTGTANTTGTAPANSVKLGTCVTGVGTVTSVAMTWASGRQLKVRGENLVMGGGAGNPRSLNLASWAASGNEGQECVGVLPPGAVPGIIHHVVTVTTTYAILVTDYYVLADATGGAFTVTLPTAAGNTGKEFEIKRLNSGANAVSIATTSAQTIDGAAGPLVLSTALQAVLLVSDGSNWWIV